MIVKDAYRFLIPLIAAIAAAVWLGWTAAAGVLLGLTLFVAFFFRNPRREIPTDPLAIVSPADGRIVKLEQVGNLTKMSIFLSIFDVHVNRSPIAGRIAAIDYRKGRFKAAFDHRASVENERNIIMVDDGRVKIVFTQIAGLIARRIVCWKKVGDLVEKGERIGLIRFGSRVDLVFPSNTEVTVQNRQYVYGGSTVLGRIKETA